MKRVFKFLKRVYISLFLLAVTATNAYADLSATNDLIKPFEVISSLIFGLALLIGGATVGFNLFKFYFGRDEDEGWGRLRNALIGVAVAAGGTIFWVLIKSLATSKLTGLQF